MEVVETFPVLTFVAGIASHLLYYHRYEFHRYVDILLIIYASTFLATVLCLRIFLGLSNISAAFTTAWLACSYLLGACGSTFIYRLIFNPLNKFPGPLAARFTNFWILLKVGKKLNMYQYLSDLHKRHGYYVRVGANRLSITDPAAVEFVYNAQSPAINGEFYDLEWPEGSMHQERDKAEHARRRRHWIPGFSDKALRDYEPRVRQFNQKFLDCVQENKGTAINVSKWFHLYSFDVMGALAFGKNYKMLESGEKHYALGVLTDGLAVMGMALPMWSLRLLKLIPGAAAGYNRFHAFCAQELRDAVNNKFYSHDTPNSTISSWLLKGYEHLPDPGNSKRFVGDSQLMIVAGSDTTAATLTFLFYELAQNPKDAKKIREELRTCAVGDWLDRDIRHCEHLMGAINETLRLWPPGFSGLYRETPPEGMHIGDVYVPGKTIFNIPQYIIARDESVYANASSFIPERWYSQPDLIKNKLAFNPFVAGSPGSCIGKNLALMEIRTLTARILLQYNVSLAPHEDCSRLLNESKDHFTMSLAPLELVFTPIEGA